MVAGDFNGHGTSDLAVARSVLPGNGDGSFASSVNYAAGQTPAFIALGDLNTDGKLDLAVANTISRDVSILLGKGDGTFSAPANFTVAANPVWLVISDFNADGRSDLAVANGSDVSILPGKGDGKMVSIASTPNLRPKHTYWPRERFSRFPQIAKPLWKSSGGGGGS